MPIYGYKRKGRTAGRLALALRGALYGFLVAPACGFVLGLLFGMPTMDLTVPPGLDAALWGAVAFGIFFGWLTTFIGMLLAMLVPLE